MMTTFSTTTRAAVLASLAFVLTPAAHAVTVPSISSTPTLIGAVVGGQTYAVSVTGIADLYSGFNGGLGLTYTADGRPTYAFPAPYAAAFPNGLPYDPSIGPSAVGPGGSTKLLGSLMGTFSSSPTGPASYFTIGLGTTFTAASTGTLYALINDSFYIDNASTGFNVTLAPVPEPATSALLLSGCAGLMLAMRRKGKTLV